MAITAAPFALKNLGLDAEPLRQALASLVPNSGGIVQTGDLAVTQTTTPSLGVSVGVGRAWMPADTTANLSGQSYSTRGQYFAINDAPFPVNLATADPSNPRIDLIYIGATDAQYGGSGNGIKIDKVTGTPAATPTVPTLPANSIALAQVAVAANATSITNSNITQVALGAVKPLGHMGKTNGFQGNLGGVTTVTMDTAQLLRGGMTFDNTNDALVVPFAGIYRCTMQSYFSGSMSGTNIAVIYKNGSQFANARYVPASADACATSVVLIQCAAGDKVYMAAQSGGASVWGTDGYNGCFLEVEYIGPA